ncbi:MAG: hypothetical protein UX31_C0001G0036 [Candidatus Nomurabacteria bacterium GW2011_GWA1_46_11]|uniref:Uncharacterized protein n=2 Tax=Parcubacteria group TaxID=1794811 RepID=A0A1F8F056_9BACT|nr:MAG: hypothetical protein UX31_C0001G0036 [Candidatus Nomurabacteria bacterium GW2011_GWA1_46_11]OGN06068.1 MAG: hypothetical protein A2669_00865 [Candidatus Yanofskybacteria bacterium RIFCSPHIGHO2_01_FULL_48_25b]
MSILISLHASEYGNLLRKLKTNRGVLICDSDVGFRTRHFLRIDGREKRPFSDQEIERLVEHYKYFANFFSKKDLLPVKKLEINMDMNWKFKEEKEVFEKVTR